MGSLFYINVPTREYEIKLRQDALNINIHDEAQNIKKDDLVNQLNSKDKRRHSNESQSGSGTTRPSITESLDPKILKEANNIRATGSTEGVHRGSDTVVDVYYGTVEGKRANIVVSKDSMFIYPVGASQQAEDEKRRIGKALRKNDTIVESVFLEKHLEELLKRFNIYDATWGFSVNKTFSAVTFIVQEHRAEEIMNNMLGYGIGTKYESTLSVCSAVVYYNPDSKGNPINKEGDDEKDSFSSNFVASIKSRLTVAQVVQSVQSNAMITFDFILLLTIAAIIAALGLLENSSVNLVASMLISPLMGPIMAGCFGTVIRDIKLVRVGVISELLGLLICLFIGFLFGVAVQWAPFDGPWAGVGTWPTDEMIGRGRARGIAVGAMVAIPSGAGVALSILAGNAGSLVGVAISASLLPPAVNCGIFWGMCAVITIREQVAGHEPYSLSCSEVMKSPNVTYRINTNPIYCENVLRDYGILGIISFGLTMVNIILILMSGFLILKLKEVAPHTTRNTMQRFWKTDLKIMRDYNKSHRGSYNKEKMLEDLNASGNPNELRAKLKNDDVFNQVQRRNVFGSSNANDLFDLNSSNVGSGEQRDKKESHNSGGSWWNFWGSSTDAKTLAAPTPHHSRPQLRKNH